MPYIDEEERLELDSAIDTMVSAIKTSEKFFNPNDLINYLGRINYCFTRVLTKLMADISYKKIAMITGVLENVKQEFYRRAVSSYEDKKINENGDIREYKLLK